MSELLLKKWREEDGLEEFAKYFKETYIDMHNGWFLGASEPGFWNTNNSLEGFN